MILMFSPALPSTRRMAVTSEPLRTKEAATKSTWLATPQDSRSSVSFSVIVGRSTTTPGRLQFLRSPMVAVLVHRACTVPCALSQEVTTSTSEPSAMRIWLPGKTSCASFW